MPGLNESVESLVGALRESHGIFDVENRSWILDNNLALLCRLKNSKDVLESVSR